MQILLVDDDHESRLYLARFLKRLGHEVMESSNGLEALNLMTLHTFNLVLTDIRMPEMSGLELLKKIKEGPGQKAIEVVVFTGFGDPDTADEAMQAGALDFFSKPIDINRLVALVDRVSEHQKLK